MTVPGEIPSSTPSLGPRPWNEDHARNGEALGAGRRVQANVDEEPAQAADADRHWSRHFEVLASSHPLRDVLSGLTGIRPGASQPLGVEATSGRIATLFRAPNSDSGGTLPGAYSTYPRASSSWFDQPSGTSKEIAGWKTCDGDGRR